MPISSYTVPASATLGKLIETINTNRSGIALVVDERGRLVTTATDGDVRRAILKRVSLETSIADLLDSLLFPKRPYVLGPEASREEALALMLEADIRQVPVLDADGVPIGIHLQDELTHSGMQPGLRAVVMAGGFGTRLRPLTADTPKPMLPVGGKPLLERMIEHMGRSGIRSVHITTHYLKDKIADYFGNGSAHGVALTYVDEEKPMGTAGALRLMTRPDEATLIINGDVLTDLDFQAMHRFHREQGAQMTMAVRSYSLTVPYGVVESDGMHVLRVVEKPRHDYFINAGIYILEPEAFDMIPAESRFDMTDLVDALLAGGRAVASYPMQEYWLDIGCKEDYARAEIDVREGRVRA